MTRELILNDDEIVLDRRKALRVMQSYSLPRPEDNPYLTLNTSSLAELVDVVHFTWRQALIGRYDIFHIHWLDSLVAGRGRVRTVFVWVGSVLLLLRLRFSGTAVVRTVHNLQIRGGLGRTAVVVRYLAGQYDKLTVVDIRLNRSQSLERPCEFVCVPHGHYREWYERYEVPDSVDGRILNFGLMRIYKGIPDLVQSFRSLTDTRLSLHLVGRIVEPELRRMIEYGARADLRISVFSRHADEGRLAREIGEAELVVLPYADFYNSGCALLALSLNRPILVPHCAAALDLQAEFGTTWVRTYSGSLADAIQINLGVTTTGVPDLSNREWTVSAARTVGAYLRAIDNTR